MPESSSSYRSVPPHFSFEELPKGRREMGIRIPCNGVGDVSTLLWALSSELGLLRGRWAMVKLLWRALRFRKLSSALF